MSRFSFILCDPLESFGDLDRVAAVFRQLANLGYQGVEFNITPSLNDCEGLLQIVRDTKLPVVSFLTGANYFGGGLCLSSANVQIRQQAVDTLCQFAATAARFGAILVVGQMQGFRSDEPNRTVAMNRIEEALRQVATAAEQAGATVVVEPVNHLQCGFHNTLAEVSALVDRIGSNRVRSMLDSFHMNIEEQSMTEPILRLAKNLAHFHLCESNGGVLGSGHLKIASILDTLGSIDYSGFVSVKVYRETWEIGARSTVNYLRSIGRLSG